MRGVLWAHLHELYGNAFQQFFHDLMALCHPGFIDVRTHGRLGDLASDGLDLYDGKLYACYAPETVDAAATVRKFWSDLAAAQVKRPGQFTAFVFVHNDVRGVQPEISVALSEARLRHRETHFEVMGLRHFRDLLGNQSSQDVEALLKTPLPLRHTTLGLPEMEELLEDLAEARLNDAPEVQIEMVSVHKLRYSELTKDTQDELRDGMKYSPLIAEYYRQRIDVGERDEVAARFHAEYADAVSTGLEPEDVLLRLREFLAGNRTPAMPRYRAQTAVLAYFFESCDIFDNVPSGWSPEKKVMEP